MDSVSAKLAILSAALPDIPFDGWEVAIRKHDSAGVYFPRGAIDAIAFHSRQADAQMAEAVAQLPLAEMRVPQKIKAAVMLRLRAQLPHREVVRKALAILAFPAHYAESLKLLYATVDTIWRATGDAANDFNWYTKRVTLAGVYSATLLFWLNDDSMDLAETEAFLERRLSDAHRLGQVKKNFTGIFARFGA